MQVDLLVAGRVTDERVRAAARSIKELDVRLAFTPEQPSLVRQLHWVSAALSYPLPWYAYGAGPRRRAFASFLRRNAGSYDVVIVEHLTLAPLRPAIGSTPCLITLHQIVSEELAQEMRSVRPRRRWLLRRDLDKAVRMERAALLGYDQIVVCSVVDAGAIAALAPNRRSRVAVVPNGADLTNFHPTPIPSEPRVLFPGSFHFPPNIHGAQWLCEEIWPRVRRALPDASLQLAGRDPDPRVLALTSHPGVSLHPNVPSMTPYFERARAIAVPLRVGTGTRLKALEAMASGRPLVGTTIGLEGIDVVDGEQARVADDAESFANALIDVLTDGEQARQLAAAGRAHVEGRFGWDRIGADYADLVRRLKAGASGTGMRP
jgi:glycosyltransferase involved in cell wall biosynthesis